MVDRHVGQAILAIGLLLLQGSFNMEQLVLKIDRAITPTEELKKVAIIIEKDKIKKLVSWNEISQYKDVLYYPNGIAIPGFSDIHTHGYGGCDVTTNNVSGLVKISKSLLKHGVTSFIPTTVTQSQEILLQVCDVVRNVIKKRVEGAEILGLHLEGPHINTGKEAGAQNIKYARNPNIEELKELIRNSGNNIKRITIAPELPKAVEYIKFAREMGIVVAVGHTNATYKEAILGFDAGITMCSHLFNGMRPFHHREPGIIGAYLVRDDVYAELITDLVHLHPGTITTVVKLKGIEKLVLITDSIAETGLANGEYELGGLKTVLKDGISRIKDTGRLAGSTLTMDVAIKNMVTQIGLDLKEAVQMATLNPAKAMKLSNYGCLAPDFVADIVILDTELNVLTTICKGEVLFSIK
ncbi:MAG: N-acetylglucosamine-6-phosphate deacetylase [Candidatus Hermodarchaeota archaeon]